MLITADVPSPMRRRFFFFNDTATTEIYTLSLHDALPIFLAFERVQRRLRQRRPDEACQPVGRRVGQARSEEHTSELQSRLHLVCRLLLEKKKERKGERFNAEWIKSSQRRCWQLGTGSRQL